MGYYSSTLLDVWGPSPNSVYTVGTLETEGSDPTRFVAHYDGVAWVPIVDDSLRWWLAAGVLAGIHGVSDSVIFVAGSRYNAGRTTGFVGRWNGSKWTNISPDSCSSLLSIWVNSASDVYAVGDTGTVVHFDGNRWRKLQSGTNLDIWQVTALPTGEVYAVASDYYSSFLGSVVLRIEGNIVTPDQFFPVGQKFGVWGTANGEMYATGEGTFHRMNRSAWQEIVTPSPRVVLWSVSGTATDNVIAAGAFGAVLHWSGRSWKFYDELYDRSSSKSYFKAFAIGNRYFLVGNTPSHALITVGTRNNP